MTGRAQVDVAFALTFPLYTTTGELVLARARPNLLDPYQLPYTPTLYELGFDLALRMTIASQL